MSRINITVAVEYESVRTGIKTEAKMDSGPFLSSLALDQAQVTQLTEWITTLATNRIKEMALRGKFDGLQQKNSEPTSDPTPTPSKPNLQGYPSLYK